jgi:hypothetical protein
LIHQILPSKPTDGLDVPEALVTDLILQRCLLAGKTNVHRRCRSLGPRSSLVERAAQELRGKKEGDALGYRGTASEVKA